MRRRGKHKMRIEIRKRGNKKEQFKNKKNGCFLVESSNLKKKKKE